MKYRVDQAKIFIGYLAKNHDFYDELRLFWYDLIFKKTIEVDGKIKWNVDTCMAMDVARDYYIWNISHGILVSWDGDFDVVLELWAIHNIWYTIFVPSYHKIPQLFLPYHQDKNPLMILTDLYDKVAQKKESG